MSDRKKRVYIVTYRLPVILHKHSCGRWSARWVADDITSRTPGSIAGVVQTQWIGVVSRECMDAGTLAWVSGEGPCTSPTPSTYQAPTDSGGGALGLDGGVAGGMEGGAGPMSWASLLPPMAALYGEGGPEVVDPGVTPPMAKCPRLTPADQAGITAALNPMGVLPVFLPHTLHEGFAAYALSVLRPALHNVLETGSQRLQPSASSLEFLARGWRHYSFANQAIATVILSQYHPTDIVWWHDFWLMRGPHFIAQEVQGRGVRQGLSGEALGVARAAQVYYMHSPFPTSEVFRTIPVRDELLLGLLQCDVVGFHSFNYARHFLHASKRILGFSHHSRPGGALAVDAGGRDVLVTISPVGVEAPTLDGWMASGQAATVARALEAQYPSGTKVVLAGVDSMQRLSGVALKLLAFERLLEDNSVYRERVVLVQRCETGGGDVLPADCATTARELRGRVASINAAYGPVIDYAEAPSFPPEARMGIFHRADILLMTPICEGLNLVPLQYVYARTRWQMARGQGMGGVEIPGGGPLAGGAPGREPPSSPMALGLSLGGDLTSPIPSHATPMTSRVSIGNSTEGGLTSSDSTGKFPPWFTVSAQEGGGGGGSSGSGNGSGSGSGSAGTSSSTTTNTSISPSNNPTDSTLLPPPLRGGCIILSEFSTAAQVLNSNLVVNPWSIKAVAKEIDKAITMPDHERAYRQWRDYQYAYKNPSATWSRAVINDLEGLRREREEEKRAVEAAAAEFGSGAAVGGGGGGGGGVAAGAGAARPHRAPPLNVGDLSTAFAGAQRRVILLDYGGSLIERSATVGSTGGFGNRADFHTDGYGQLLPQPVLDALAALAGDPKTVLYVVSGLRTSAIEALKVSSLKGAGLAAEYGLFLSHPEVAATAAAAAATAATDTPVASTSTTSVRTMGLSRERSSRGIGVFGTGKGVAAVAAAAAAPTAPPPPATPGMPNKAHPPTPRQWQRASLDEGMLVEWAAVKRCVCAVMADYEGRVNGSVLREYDSLVAWDFRAVDAEWAVAQARFLALDCEQAIAKGGMDGAFSGASASAHVQVSLRNARVEVSLRCINKGTLAKAILDRVAATSTSPPIDFILAIGDDATDEASFEAVGQWKGGVAHACTTFTATVGKKAETCAGAFCADVLAVHATIIKLAESI